jgi:hypothetical protein
MDKIRATTLDIQNQQNSMLALDTLRMIYKFAIIYPPFMKVQSFKNEPYIYSALP